MTMRIIVFTALAIVWVCNGIFAILNQDRDYRVSYISTCFSFAALMLLIAFVGLAK